MKLTCNCLLAVALAAIGLYGVMACLVVERTREIGVRMALGASRLNVLAMMIRQAGAMTGVVVGLAGALALSRYLAALVFGVSATDPLIYAFVAVILGAVALAAIAIPSSRATKIDPLQAIRS